MAKVTQVGRDPSGRPIFMSSVMKDWWDELCDRLGFTPTIVQGSWMSLNGRGAAASAGTHDRGGCLDLRVWDRKDEEVYRIIRTARLMAGAAWLRDSRHGMDPHIHLVVEADPDKTWQASRQWTDYVNGLNGLANKGKDYEWRPSPLVRKWTPMKKPRRMPKAWHKFYHPLPYYIGNSLRGLRQGHKKGYKRHDIDGLMSKDYVWVAAHWDLPLWHGFFDPLKRTAPSRRIRSMSWEHLKRLRPKRNRDIRINMMWEILKEAKALGTAIEFDVKHDDRLNEVEPWRELKDMVDYFDVEFLVKTTSNLPRAHRRLRAAKEAGFTTAVLPRGKRVLRRSVWWPVADYVRGPVKWV